MKNIKKFIIIVLAGFLFLPGIIGVYANYPIIGNFVWADSNANGIQDAGEPGIANVTVNLYNGLNEMIGTANTNTSGYYYFYASPYTKYYVEFVLPDDYVFSPQDQGSDDTVDSDADTSTGQTIILYTQGPGSVDMTWDCGMYQTQASIGDFVWTDSNANGIQDAGEPGIADVTVDLYLCDDTFVDSTTTIADGSYWFTDLTPDSYYLKFIAPPGYSFTVQDAGDDTLDSDVDSTGQTIICTDLQPGETDDSWDAGLILIECGECDGKITQLTIQYNGTDEAWIQVEQKKPKEMIFEDNVMPYDDFTFNGTDKKGTMGTEISIYVDSILDTKIHTSCSKPICPGMVFGSFKIIAGYSRNGGLLCPCEFPPGGGYCEDGVKPCALTMLYTGENCSASNHHQDPKKVKCNGDPAFTDPVHILATDKKNPDDPKAKIWFDGIVDLNAEFVINATNAGETKLKASTHVFIYNATDDTLLQTIEFHTSCSQPLFEDDQFASLKLTGFVAEE